MKNETFFILLFSTSRLCHNLLLHIAAAEGSQQNIAENSTN